MPFRCRNLWLYEYYGAVQLLSEEQCLVEFILDASSF